MNWRRSIFWQMAVTVLLFSLAVTGCGAEGGAPSDIAFDPLTMHFAIVMAIMIVAYGLLEVLHKIPLFSGFAIYVPAIIVSLVAGIILRKTRLGDFLDSESLAHIGSLALEYLIVTAIATMKLDVIMNNVPRLWLKEHWLENAMVMFGSWTGSTATGMMLLRIADPELETDCCWDL